MQRFDGTEIGPMIEATCAEGNFIYYNFGLEPLRQPGSRPQNTVSAVGDAAPWLMQLPWR